MTTHRALNALVLAVLLLVTLTLPAAGAPAADVRPTAALDKIEPLVLEELTPNGRTDFFVWLVETADLRPANQLLTKEEKGRFVFEALFATAERTQKALRSHLESQGVEYRPYYIANKILVRGGGQALLLDVAARPDVAQVTANHQYQLDEPFVDPRAREQILAIETNITFINADDVWALGYDGSGTVMAGNDTGLDETHPAVARHYRGCLNPPTCTSWDHNYNWWDATGTYPTNPYDGHGHGTHTTGTMVGDDGGSNQIGVAPGAQTIHCKNMTDGGSGSDATFSECFEWDLAPWNLNGLIPRSDLAPDAVNNSWGYSGGNQPQFQDEIDALQAAGILVEVSAGNEGASCATLRSPGDYQEVLTTGSVNHASAFPGTITGFSSRGPSDLDGNYFPDIMAPGESIRSSLPGGTYASWSGTSMAGPHATALVGLIWSACPSLEGTVAETMSIIRDTAVPLTGQTGSNCGGNYTTGPNNDWGMGTIDALAAVQQAVAQCAGLGTLEGTVTDSAAGLPIEGAAVSAVWAGGGTWNDTTDAAGFFQMTVPIGLYDVSVAKFAYISQIADGVEVLEDATTTRDFALDLAPTRAVSGTVRDAVTNEPLYAQVEAVDAPVAPVWTDPGTGFYAISVPEGTYTFRASAALHRPQDQHVVVDGDKIVNFFLPQLPCILLVDDDNNAPDVRPFFTGALDGLGYDYDVFDVGGEGGNGPTPAGLEGYRMVIWFSGDKWGSSAGPNGTDESNLAVYLDGGGRLFLSSQDYLYDFGLTAFGSAYLGIGTYSNDTGNATAKYGVTGDPVGGGLGPYTLAYPSGFTDYGDIVNAGAGASVAFRTSASGGNNLDVDKDGGAWRTVFFGTSWVPVYNASAAAGEEVLQRIFDWFGVCGDAPPSVSIEDPVEGQELSGTYRVLVSAADDSAVTTVELRIDGGTYVGITDNRDGTDYYYDWETTAYADGPHTLQARATDDAGLSTESAAVNVTVDNVNEPPVASFTYDCTGLSCDFDASSSSDPDGTIASYDWTFDDGNTGSGMVSTHTYSVGGTYEVVLTVTDDRGAADWRSELVTVAQLVATMHVADISMSSAPLNKKNFKIEALATIVDQNGDPVEGATVQMQWTLPPRGKTRDQEAVTDLNGVASFEVTGAGGTYGICVMDVAKAGWTYESAHNVETCDNLTVQ